MFLLPGGSEQALIDAINAANQTLPKPLTANDLYFGKVNVLGNDDVSIPAVAMWSSEFTGYIRFEYKRLDLGKVFGDIRPTVERIGYPSLYRMLPIINEVLGLTLTENDVEDVQITWLSANEQINIPLVAKLESKAYTGQFVVKYVRLRPELTELAIKELSVLNHPIDPTLGKRSLAMCTWGIDFTTDYANGTLSIWSGTWSKYSQFKAMMEQRGFPNFPQTTVENRVRGYATTLVPGSNPAFQYVIVQRGVELQDHLGDAYIHYNIT